VFIRETIREHFQRAQKRLTMSMVTVLLVAAFAGVYLLPRMARQHAWIGGALLGLGVACALVLLSKGSSACPKCHADLARLRTQEVGRSDKRRFWQLWDKCPKCGIDFNDVLPY
jgi:hypothetical protein